MIKKTIIFILIFSNLFNISKTFSYNLTNKDIIIINKVTYKLNKRLNKYNYEKRLKIINKIKLLKNKYKNNKKIYLILDNIVQKLEKIYNNTYKLNGLKIDINQVKNNWLIRHNEKRIGTQKLSYSDLLNNTANAWSYEMAKRGIMTHKRNPNTKNYYNHNEIKDWLKERGIVCTNNKGITNSESIGINYFKCNKNNCTENLDKALKEVFNLYYQEKGLPYPQNAHYKAIVHPGLSKIGLGLVIKNDDYGYYKVYITTHYCSKLKK